MKTYLFHINEYGGLFGPTVSIVEDTFWQKNKCLADKHLGTIGRRLLPEDGWGEEAESVYSHYDKTTDDYFSVGETRAWLLGHGFVEITDWTLDN